MGEYRRPKNTVSQLELITFTEHSTKKQQNRLFFQVHTEHLPKQTIQWAIRHSLKI